MKNFIEAEKNWELLEDIPINKDEEIEENFLHFPLGTNRNDIWHWFEMKYDLSVAEDLMYVT